MQLLILLYWGRAEVAGVSIPRIPGTPLSVMCLCYQHRGEREKHVLDVPCLFLSTPGHTGYPSHKAWAKEENAWIEPTELHPPCHSLSSSPLSGCVWSGVRAMALPAPSALYRTSLFLSPAESSNPAFPEPPGNFLGSMIPVSLDLFHSWWRCCWPGFALLSSNDIAAQRMRVFDDTKPPSL